MGELAGRGEELVRVWFGARDSGFCERARFVHEMDKVVQTTAGVEEWVKGEVVSVEVLSRRWYILLLPQDYLLLPLEERLLL